MANQKTLQFEHREDFVQYVKISLKAKRVSDFQHYMPYLFCLPKTAIREEVLGFGRYNDNLREALGGAEATIFSRFIRRPQYSLIRRLDSILEDVGINNRRIFPMYINDAECFFSKLGE